MRIVKLKAGLGNQMFQYAFYSLLRNKCIDDVVLLDIAYYDSPKYRKFFVDGIGKLNVSFQVAKKNQINKMGFIYNGFEPHTAPHRLISGIQAVFNPKYYFERSTRDMRYVDIDTQGWEE